VGRVCAAYGRTGAPVAYAWHPPSRASAQRRDSYFDRRIAATVVAEPLVDPEMKKIRS
jgi:hypothetical protein